MLQHPLEFSEPSRVLFMQLSCVCQAGGNENKRDINFTFVCPFTSSGNDTAISQNNYRKLKCTECLECVLSNTTASTVAGERKWGWSLWEQQRSLVDKCVMTKCRPSSLKQFVCGFWWSSQSGVLGMGKTELLGRYTVFNQWHFMTIYLACTELLKPYAVIQGL